MTHTCWRSNRHVVSARLRWLGTGTTQVANIACLARDRWRALLRAPILQVDGHLITACLPLLIQQRRHVVVQVHPATQQTDAMSTAGLPTDAMAPRAPRFGHGLTRDVEESSRRGARRGAQERWERSRGTPTPEHAQLYSGMHTSAHACRGSMHTHQASGLHVPLIGPLGGRTRRRRAISPSWHAKQTLTRCCECRRSN